MHGREARPDIEVVTVRLQITPELASLLGDWSRPVRVRVRRDDGSPTGWVMDVREAPGAGQERR